MNSYEFCLLQFQLRTIFRLIYFCIEMFVAQKQLDFVARRLLGYVMFKCVRGEIVLPTIADFTADLICHVRL